jgi:hypothetical protein
MNAYANIGPGVVSREDCVMPVGKRGVRKPLRGFQDRQNAVGLVYKGCTPVIERGSE